MLGLSQKNETKKLDTYKAPQQTCYDRQPKILRNSGK